MNAKELAERIQNDYHAFVETQLSLPEDQREEVLLLVSTQDEDDENAQSNIIACHASAGFAASACHSLIGDLIKISPITAMAMLARTMEDGSQLTDKLLGLGLIK